MSEIISINGGTNTVTPGALIKIDGVDFGFTPFQVIASPSNNPDDSGAQIFSPPFAVWVDTSVWVQPPPGQPTGRPYWFVRDSSGLVNAQGFYAPNPSSNFGGFTQTYYQLINHVKGDLGNRRDIDEIVREAIQERINYYQNEGFAVQEVVDESLSTVNGQNAYDVPTGTIQITGVQYLYGGNTWIPLWPIEIEDLLTMNDVVPDVTAPPNNYALYGQQIWLYPTPNDIWTLQLTMIQVAPPPVFDTDSNFWTQTALSMIRHDAAAQVFDDYLHIPDTADRLFARSQREYVMLRELQIKGSSTNQIKGWW